MVEPDYDYIMDYVISSRVGNIKTRGNKQLNKVIIDENEYTYNKEKPFSNRLKKKLRTLSKTQGFKRYDILKTATKGIAIRKALKKYVISKKAKVTDETSAFKRYANSYSISNINLKGYKGLSHLKYQEPRLKEFLGRNNNMKIRIDVDASFNHPEHEEPQTYKIGSRIHTINNPDELKTTIGNMASDIEIKVENSQLRKSGYTINKIESIRIHYDKYNPTRAGKYIELPKWIATKKACINIKNDDDYCFKYCVQSRFYEIMKKDHPDRMYHYNKLKENDNLIKWEGVEFPAENEDINTFEEINDRTISVNVYAIDPNGTNSIVVNRISKIKNPSCHVNLLLLEEESNNHYVLIKDYSRLMGAQTNKHREKLFHCRYCQHGFNKESFLNNHLLKGCMANEIQQIVMPKEDEKMSFQKHYKKLKCPYVIYGDFECLTTPSSDGVKGTYQHHKPCGFMLNVVNSITNEATPYLYRGEDCMDRFCSTINKIKEEIMEKMKENKKLQWTARQKEEHKHAKHCFICGGKFNPKDPAKTKVADHCHFTGEYRGAAHNKCNLDYCFKYFKIPVFFHNLKNYDAHLIISHMEKLNKNKDKISVIAQNSEKFVAFTVDNLEFKDSFSFLSSSLDKLVKLTKYEKDEKRMNWASGFKFSKKNIYVNDESDLDLLTDKGVYPYDYFTDFTKFNETSLPKIEDFYSKLTEEGIKQSEYDRANKIWEHFKIQNLGQYHDLYLQTDVLLLTDVFENFRKTCLVDYGLDPAHYITLPNFSWDAMLLKTGIELELIHDEDIYKMVENGLRGGMCQVSMRKAEANNPYMGEQYDENKETSYINYLDANNLYGLAICQKLPYKDIKFINDLDNFTEKEILNYDDGDEGYILDVDLEYPKELHDKHIDYSLAPQIMNVNASMLSDCQKEIYKSYHENKEPKDEQTKKLILNVMDKSNYVLHINILKFYLKQGLKLKKVNRVISFKQKQWLKPWIDFNTEKRKQATSDFEKDKYKLMNNAVYGKTMENVREHINFELVDTQERYAKCVNNPTFKHRHIINENLVGVEKLKEKVKLNKPTYVEMSILDLSKLHMYSFYYDVLKEKYNENVRLVYTDTDSFVIHTKTKDVYDDFNEIKDQMDFSDYPKDHKCFNINNKKRLGCFKDECHSKIITKFIGLKPKSYAFKVYNEEKEEKKSKGIVKHKVKKELSYKQYEDTLIENRSDTVSFNTIRSKNHNIYTINQVKQCLSSFDNKRYYLDSVNSLPYGHYLT